ncbi:MAG: RES family NAD+ phosphorylase [Verrucomicrobia bacterium]|nr:RES family NAD+ phosphorylase [Verrucomicrobiota bacterium]
MDPVDAYLAGLRKLRRKFKSGQLARCVTRQAVERKTPPDFLFAAKRAGRYNPEGVECLYWAEDENTARLEYRRYNTGAATYETFFCHYECGVLDLGNPNVLAALGIEEVELYANWRTAPDLTKTQLLGLAVSLQQRFAAIRFPSDAARSEGDEGFNLVVFRNSLRDPSWIEVVTDPGLPQQRWP